ncbi:MAG TPA: hypothetical protein VLF89_09560 [Candidatus Saccharimonadales bacterium]|nr:hypothetical protein [Candidatus Saccharimonadales bacterium]
MQNKSLFVALGVLVLIIVSGIGIFYIASSRKATITTKNGKNYVDSPLAPVATLTPDQIGFSMELAQSGQSAGHAIDMKITKIEGITGVDYEFSYIYGDSLNQGGFGHLDVKSGASSLSQEIVLGTCSSGVCRYDVNVSHFKMVLRITKDDGKTYQVTKEMDL